MIIDTLLDNRSLETREFAAWLYAHPDDIPPSSVTEPPVADIAMWGIGDAEWFDAVTAVRIAVLSDNVTPRCPVFVLSNSKVEIDGGRVQIWSGAHIRPSLLEDAIGRSLDQNDEQVINEIVRILPQGWSLVIESRGVRSAMADDDA